ncbi:hypothetical protein A2866_00880 [Candidatus Roizmanbacteria bacterium RIFCSPHIGHO2_01_FULL_39_8]|uniref:Ribosome recycling factor domain-containing protein n=2 Tax=Candidatus Roizmaniibacteriota TaxID=1752723 RepID=A0A1F7GHV3_9BACT|nr:MAG: hypothetical protein A2866_00880 [Candidatus Roizmanbacteria bacterium RIFCSPHIGHO2_01_FULL_39_8]OGK35615.1 MAG: hypothetical protein A3F60_01475 [Candidatus Roizmanbacteria bacterium RIFCSPHIGHO2_12_FULL_39_8]
MDPILTHFEQSTIKVINFLKEDLKSIRTGKANPSLIENLVVEAYGGQSRLKLLELATLTVEGPSALGITPYDPSTISDIEKAILKSPLGISPAVQGNRILAKIPALSQEQREKFTKIVAQKIEEKKNQIRGARDEARRKIKSQFEAKEISEDEKFREEKDIDNLTKNYMEELQGIKESKEKEIREI